jgi:hypothetical protein
MYNSPASLAMQEAAAIYPETPKPSLVVSFGTGIAKENGLDTTSSSCFWKKSFFTRIFQVFWQYGNSTRAWQQLLGHQAAADSRNFFRFNVEFTGEEPRLDDVKAVKEIANRARASMTSSADLDRLVLRQRAELLYFELDRDSPFKVMGGGYVWNGKLRCRLGSQAREVFMVQLKQASARIIVGSRSTGVDFQLVSTGADTGRFCQAIQITTAGRADPIEIFLQEGDEPCPISGAPFSLQWLLQRQKLDARFGISEHRKRGPPSHDGQGTQSQKRVCRR